MDSIDIKIIIIGDSGVGKSSFLKSFDNDYIDCEHSNPSPTIGIDFITKELIFEDQRLKMRIWDSAGMFLYIMYLY